MWAHHRVSSHANRFSQRWQYSPARTLWRRGAALRWSLVLIFLWFGFLKFTADEAEGIVPFAMNSALLSWAYQMLGQRGFAMALGVVELSIGMLIALRPLSARLSGTGSVGSIITYLITLSFLLSTPWRLARRLRVPVTVRYGGAISHQGRSAAGRFHLDCRGSLCRCPTAGGANNTRSVNADWT